MGKIYKRIGVIGAGAWGTALSTVAQRQGHETLIWAREITVVESINVEHQNTTFLDNTPLDPRIVATTDLKKACEVDVILLVVPGQFLRNICKQLAPYWKPGVPAVICSKGIEEETCALMTEVVSETLRNIPQAVLSGPTFAKEVARGLPTAVTLACKDDLVAGRLIKTLSSPTFRVYRSTDLIGAEIGGAVKNVLAIACGIASGLGLGSNARAALITRGLTEMLRLGSAKGAQPQTLSGLCGLGDLVLTCSSEQSRNMSLGVQLGLGESFEKIMSSRNSVAEGVFNSRAVSKLAHDLSVEMPISEAVNAILHKRAAIDAELKKLLSRPSGEEVV